MPEIESKLKTLVINNNKEDRNGNGNVDEINFDADGQEQAQQVEQQNGGDGNEVIIKIAMLMNTIIIKR